MTKLYRSKRQKGTAVAEVPIALWIFIFLLMLPLMGLATVWYRAALVFFAVRDCTYQAAKQATFTDASTVALSTLTRDANAWTGVSITGTPQVKIVVIAPASSSAAPGASTETEQTTPISSWNSSDIYMIRTYITASVAPIVNMGGASTFANVPGLTQPMTLNFTYQVYAENPQGLTS